MIRKTFAERLADNDRCAIASQDFLATLAAASSPQERASLVRALSEGGPTQPEKRLPDGDDR